MCLSREHCFWEEVGGIRLCISPDNCHMHVRPAVLQLSAKHHTDQLNTARTYNIRGVWTACCDWKN